VVAKQLWGEDRVTIELPGGALSSIPVSWTDFLPSDPYQTVGNGRSRFRVDDLIALADLVALLTEKSVNRISSIVSPILRPSKGRHRDRCA